MQLAEILAFVRGAEDETWNLIIREMNRTRRQRNETAANCFRVGQSVRVQPPADWGQPPLEGRIVKVGRSRVILAVANESGFLERVSVPASLAARIV